MKYIVLHNINAIHEINSRNLSMIYLWNKPAWYFAFKSWTFQSMKFWVEERLNQTQLKKKNTSKQRLLKVTHGPPTFANMFCCSKPNVISWLKYVKNKNNTLKTLNRKLFYYIENIILCTTQKIFYKINGALGFKGNID